MIEGMQMGYLKDFRTQIHAHNYPAFLRLWEEYCAGDEIDPEELITVLKEVKNSEFAEPFGKYVENILPLWEQMPASKGKEDIFRLVIDLETTHNEALYLRVIDYLKARYGEQSSFSEKLRLVGLRSKENLKGAISHFELLNHMEKGNFVFHTGGWGVGEIVDVSLIREQLALEFEYVSGRKDLSFANAFKTLIPLPKDHFLSLRFGNADLLEKQAKEDPVKVIHLLLRDLGPKTAAEIKDELCDLVIPEKEWVKWWQTARAKIKKDTLIETPPELRDPFILRQTEVTHEERLQKAIESAPDASTLIQVLYTFLRDFPEILKKPDFKLKLSSKLEETLLHPNLSEAEKLQLHLFGESLGKEETHQKAIQTLIQTSGNLQTTIQSTEIVAFKKRILVLIRKFNPAWKDLFLSLLFNIDQNPIRDYLLSELSSPDTERDLKKKLEDLWVHPGRYPELFLWYFQKIVSDPSLPYADKEGKNRFFEAFFILLNHIENSASHKDLIKKMYGILTAGRFAVVREIMQGADAQTVHEFLLLASKCHSLPEHDIKILYSLAEVVHPSLGKLRKKQDGGSENNLIWTTEAGYKKIKERIEQIATVEALENAKELGIAREHGDLKENAEFKAAVQKRDRLQSELKMLSEQMNKARILTKEDVSTDVVGVGTVVECRNDKGKLSTYTFLGPWDADPEKSILSFQSKLAQAMKGLTLGDKFQFQGEEFTVEKIHNYFKDT